jgi:uncharacterized membrane protein HdeD (DUF308 family)
MSELSDIARLPARVGTGWGFAVMLLGVLAVMVPFVSGVAVTSFVAVLITAAGLTMTMYAFKAGSFGKGLLQFLFGGITVICGVAMFVTPLIGMFTLTGVLMVYFLVDGIFAIFSGVKGRPAPGWGWVTISGIVSIVLAVLLYREWPDSGTYAVGLLVGIRLIFTGWSIAMLGMLGDASVDVAKEVVEEAVQQSDNA